MSVVYLAARSHTPVVDELMFAGIQVWEALSVSEVLHLGETHRIDAVVISAEVVHREQDNVNNIRKRWMTLEPQPFVNGTEIAFELYKVVRQRGKTVQYADAAKVNFPLCNSD
jgi:hypothetical protein